MNAYEQWKAAELRWTEGLRRHGAQALKKAALGVLLPFAGGALMMMFAVRPYAGSWGDAAAAALVFFLLGVLLAGLIVLCCSSRLRPKWYAKRLETCAAGLALDPAGREALGQDLLAALEDPAGHFDFLDQVQEKHRTPAHFVLGRQYVFLTRNNYFPALFPLAGVTGLRTLQSGAAVGGQVVRWYNITLEGLPQEAILCFHDPESRDRALCMLERQLAERNGSAE